MILADTTPAPARTQAMRRSVLLLLAGLVALAGLTALALTAPPGPLDRLSSEAAPHLARLPAEEAGTRGIDLAKWALSGLHRGIDPAGTDASRVALDRLVTPALAAALEGGDTLALLADTGLRPPAHAVHEVELVRLSVRTNGPQLMGEGSWRVLGLVDPVTHEHAAGNLFSGSFTLERGPEVWRLTAVNVDSVDGSGAGRVVE